MTARTQPPTLTRRRRRLSDTETERRMLDSAAALVNRTGLTVSLEHLSFEDVIRDANVSRSTAYRRWPYKDLFFADLLRELARAATPAAVASAETAIPELREIVLSHSDWLGSSERRRDLLLELMRRGSQHDFETVRTSTEWRTYLALQATFQSIEEPGLRSELQAALAGSEHAFIARIAASWQTLASLLGFRPRPELDASFDAFARMASADLRGHVMLSFADPLLATRTVRAQPFGASEPADWSLPALAIASLASAFFEPDPSVVWDPERVAAVLSAFKTLATRAQSGDATSPA